MSSSEYYQPELETISRSELQQLQLERARKTIATALNAPFYKEKYGKLGLDADSLRSLDDLKKFPFTTKQDLRDHYPYGLVATDRRNLVRLHSSSGTTGNPTVIFHTKNDLDCWANRVARSLYMVGLRNTDVFQNTSG